MHRQDIEHVIKIGKSPLSTAQVYAIARGESLIAVDLPEVSEKIARSRRHLKAALERGEPIYGVTTGYGGSCGSRVDADRSTELGENLIRYHGAGSGEPLGIVQTRAAMVCRLMSLLKGYSGVSMDLLDRIVLFLNNGITPVMPSLGSVGASGDLTPLSYLAATLEGKRDVFFRGRRMPASEALEAAGIRPYRFKPKEPLAMINGTSVMTGIAVVVVESARRVLDAAIAAAAMAVHGMAGHRRHFRPEIFAAKPFPGQARVAAKLWTLLEAVGQPQESERPEHLQDPYSLRCTPHVLGVLDDALDWIQKWVETEANGVSDNPLLEPETGEVMTGGNFYGGHIAFAMDAIKPALASTADLMDRQFALLVDTRFNRGLPSNLVGLDGPQSGLHHGFKALQITASAITAEAAKDTMPAAVFSRSTESHNQDKVSLGTIAARDADRVMGLASHVVGAQVLAAAQAAELRGGLETRPGIARLVSAVRNVVPMVREDRPLDADLQKITGVILDKGIS